MNKNVGKQTKELLLTVVSLAVIGVMLFSISSCKGRTSLDSADMLLLKSSVDFQKIYRDCDLNRAYATVASDGSYLKISFKASDIKSYNLNNYKNAPDSYVRINRKLGLPEVLNEKIETATALDGKQSENFDNVKVTWSYSPSNGVMILYEHI